jgi:hypothetical protein
MLEKAKPSCTMQGWCPPLPMLRYLGVRTAEEIHDERMALRVIRGDYEALAKKSSRAEMVKEMIGNKRAQGGFMEAAS